MRTIDLPDGHTAQVREASEFRGRDRNLVKAAGVAAGVALRRIPEGTYEERKGESDEDRVKRINETVGKIEYTRQEAATLMDLREATVIASLASWTRPEPLPTIDTVGDLDADLYDALIEAVSGVAEAEAIDVKFDAKDLGDKESPTTASGGSNGPSEASQPKTSTSRPQSEPESTPTGSSTD